MSGRSDSLSARRRPRSPSPDAPAKVPRHVDRYIPPHRRQASAFRGRDLFDRTGTPRGFNSNFADRDRLRRDYQNGYPNHQYRDRDHTLPNRDDSNKDTSAKPAPREVQTPQADQQAQAHTLPLPASNATNLVSAEFQRSLTHLIVDSPGHFMYEQNIETIVKEMCREAPSQIIKSQPLEVISSVMKHTQGTEAKKKAVLSTLTHEWMKKVAKHFCAVLDAAGKEGMSGVHGMKQMFIQAGLIDADDNNAAPANNTRRRSEKEDDTIVVSSSPAPKTIDPLPFEVAQYDDQSRNDYTLLLKPEPSQTGRSDPPTPIEGDIEQSITKKIAESQFSEQTWSLEEFAHNHWLVHFEEEEHAKGLVNRSIKVDGGYKLSFEQFGKKLSQVFVCSTVPKNVSHDRILSTIVEARPDRATYMAKGSNIMVMMLDKPDNIKWVDMFSGQKGKSGKQFRFEVSMEGAHCTRCGFRHVASACPALRPMSLSSGERKSGLLEKAPKVI